METEKESLFQVDDQADQDYFKAACESSDECGSEGSEDSLWPKAACTESSDEGGGSTRTPESGAREVSEEATKTGEVEGEGEGGGSESSENPAVSTVSEEVLKTNELDSFSIDLDELGLREMGGEPLVGDELGGEPLVGDELGGDICEIDGDLQVCGGDWDMNKWAAICDANLGGDVQDVAGDTLTFVIFVVRQMFNTLSGICGWVPALYQGRGVVIISLGVVKWFLSVPLVFTKNGTKHNVTVEDVEKFLRDKVCGGGSLGVNWSDRSFYNTLMQTPFQPAPLSRPRANCKKFLVAPLDGFMEKVLKPGLDVGMAGVHSDLTRLTQTPPPELGQQFSFIPSGSIPPCLKHKQGSYKLSATQKEHVPAFGVPWWGALFSEVVLKCFGLTGHAGEVDIVNSEVRKDVQHEEYSVVQDRMRKM